jgi:hypothetical protein
MWFMIFIKPPRDYDGSNVPPTRYEVEVVEEHVHRPVEDTMQYPAHTRPGLLHATKDIRMAHGRSSIPIT